MSKKMIPLLAIAAACAATSLACHKNSEGKGPIEAAGEKVDEGATKTKNAAENAGEGIKDGFESDAG